MVQGVGSYDLYLYPLHQLPMVLLVYSETTFASRIPPSGNPGCWVLPSPAKKSAQSWYLGLLRLKVIFRRSCTSSHPLRRCNVDNFLSLKYSVVHGPRIKTFANGFLSTKIIWHQNLRNPTQFSIQHRPQNTQITNHPSLLRWNFVWCKPALPRYTITTGWVMGLRWWTP